MSSIRRSVAENTPISALGNASLGGYTAAMPTGVTARVLFDEAHSEAWTIRPELAAEMQPAHPADASYALAARALSEREFAVAPNVEGRLTPDGLEDCDLL